MVARPRGDPPEFPPQVLREYALLADGERGALIGPHGDVVWMCLPRWDDPPLFSALLGGPSSYAVTPIGRFVWGGYYEAGSLIWRSRWVTDTGVVECREALAFPANPHRAVLLRRVRAVRGCARVLVTLDLRPGPGRPPVADAGWNGGVWTARVGDLRLRWTGGAGAGGPSAECSVLARELELPPGGHHDLVLEIGDQRLSDLPVDPDGAWDATSQAWSAAVPALPQSIAAADARHAYAVLRGLTGESGGMVAAATTSLPEHAGEDRNYDYRYVWIRDQCYAGQAVAAAGPLPLLDDAVRFVAARMLEHGVRLQPAYTCDGGRVPDQRPLELPGYPGGHDVVGNRVRSQFQLDPFGEAWLLFAAAARHDHLGAEGWRAAEVAVSAIAERWTEPDAGIWEIDNRPWTHSRLICAAGLRAIAGAGASRSRAGSWLALADRILEHTAAHATHPDGRWQRSPHDPGLDAALLLPPLRGAPARDDPRTTATLDAYVFALTRDGYAYRFRHNRRPLECTEGAFLLCGFILALAAHQQGREVEAHRWFERHRAACGPPALFSEEFDVAQRQLRGNLPQAFVHALMLEASLRLAKPWGGV